jgi:SHS2 domain-containing protein
MGTFRFLDEIAIADCAVDVTSATAADLFETAAQALVEVMVDPQSVPVSVERRVSLEAPAPDLLLFDWLSELVCRKDEDSEVFTHTHVELEGEGPYRLTARLEGGPIVPGSTGLRADVKGVTLHCFVLERRGEGWHASFVLDL